MCLDIKEEDEQELAALEKRVGVRRRCARVHAATARNGAAQGVSEELRTIAGAVATTNELLSSIKALVSSAAAGDEEGLV